MDKPRARALLAVRLLAARPNSQC